MEVPSSSAPSQSPLKPAIEHASASPFLETEPQINNLKSTILQYEKLASKSSEGSSSRRPVNSKFRLMGPMGRSKNDPKPAPSSNKPTSSDLDVNLLCAQNIGHFPSSTTLKELRDFISNRTGSSAFSFLDGTTRRPLLSDTLRLGDLKAPLYVVQQSLGHLLADAALQNRANSIVEADKASFLVKWWDGKQLRPVWLRFDLNLLTVTWKGSSFRLFDPRALMFSPMILGTRGSDKGFQIVNPANHRSSRFFAQSVEQKHLITVHFCFVWRPSLIRRGVIRSNEIDIMKVENALDAPDPRIVAQTFRRHVAEVSKLISLLETGCDTNTAKRYLALFAQMFSEGARSMRPGDLGDSAFEPSLEFGRAGGKLLQDWHKRIMKRPSESKIENQSAPPPASSKLLQAEDIAFGDFYDAVADPLLYTEPDAAIPRAPVMSADGIPLPPPPPPPPALLVQLPSIRKLEFGALSAAQIADTVWAELSGFKMKDAAAAQLEETLKILFGKDVPTKDEVSIKLTRDGMLKYQATEMEFRSGELKDFDFAQVLDFIMRFDSRLFNAAVLSRLSSTKSIAQGRGPEFSFLLYDKEKVKELEARADAVGFEGLIPVEQFIYQVHNSVPDRFQRFSYGYWMARADTDFGNLKEQLSPIFDACSAIRGSSKLKTAMKLILLVLTTMTPGTGLTRGFKMSVVLNCFETSGRVYNPNPPPAVPKVDELAPVAPKALDSVDAVKSAEPNSKATRLAKLAVLRQKKADTEDDSWRVNLKEFLSVHLNRFEACQGFWTELLPVCSEAMKLELNELVKLKDMWKKTLEDATEFKEEITKISPDDAFPAALNKFVAVTSAKIHKFETDLKSALDTIEDLWKWFGESMVGEPTEIFKNVFTFCDLFSKQWKLSEAAWEQKRTMVLRGALPLRKPPAIEKKKNISAPKGASPSKLKKLPATQLSAEVSLAPPQEVELPGGEAQEISLPADNPEQADAMPEASSPPFVADPPPSPPKSKRELKAAKKQQKELKKTEAKASKKQRTATSAPALSAPSSSSAPSLPSSIASSSNLATVEPTDSSLSVSAPVEINAKKPKKSRKSKDKKK